MIKFLFWLSVFVGLLCALGVMHAIVTGWDSFALMFALVDTLCVISAWSMLRILRSRQ